MIDQVIIPVSDTPALAPGQVMPEGTPTAEEQVAAPVATPEGIPAKFIGADGAVDYAGMAKAYSALEAKMGAGETAPTEEPAVEATPVTYGSAVDTAISAAGMTPAEMNQEWIDNGSLTDATYTKLETAGFPRTVVEAYIKGISESTADNVAQQQVADQRVKDVQETVGGEQQYNSMVNWASANLNEAEIVAFDTAVTSGDQATMNLAVAGLNAKYKQAEGYAGKLTLGGQAGNQTDVYNSPQEMATAMTKARNSRDPAQVAMVEQKAMRSNVFG